MKCLVSRLVDSILEKYPANAAIFKTAVAVSIACPAVCDPGLLYMAYHQKAKYKKAINEFAWLWHQ